MSHDRLDDRESEREEDPDHIEAAWLVIRNEDTETDVTEKERATLQD